MTKRSVLALLVSASAALAGCSMSSASSELSSADEGARNAGPGGAMGEPGAPASGEASSDVGGSGTPGAEPQAGLLTAGAWDDNLNFDFYKKYVQASATTPGISIFTDADRDAAHERALVAPTAKSELDVTILFDTTGSMGDELRFLQTEFSAIATTLKTKFPQVTPRFGLVLYRDHGDAYVTRKFDFTQDASAFASNLDAQSAAGGGDWPEAVPEGLQEGVGLSWRTTPNVARLMFWVADAPQHTGKEASVKVAIEGAVQKGIHVYPVAASGTAADAELTFRSAAQITGGRYLFLTDDSGIGNAHAEPHIPCYQVTRLDGAIVRMVDSEMRGHRVEPTAEEIIRTVGNPVEGKCKMKDQSETVLY
ncbi:MAG: VWA domain-containing protein [Labilithrix sp.]|nr:VWA domain-containing protein [Labilithrix sp.]